MATKIRRYMSTEAGPAFRSCMRSVKKPGHWWGKSLMKRRENSWAALLRMKFFSSRVDIVYKKKIQQFKCLNKGIFYWNLFYPHGRSSYLTTGSSQNQQWLQLIRDYKIWGFAWWKSVSSRFAVTPCVISTIAKLRYRFWKEPNRTTRISTVAKWEIWFRENHGDFTGSSLRFD